MKPNREYISKGFAEWFYDGNEPIIGSNLTSDMNDAYTAGFEDAFYLLSKTLEETSITQRELDMAKDIYIADKALYQSAKGAMLRVIKFILECRRLQIKMEMENEG